jgi:Domain of unknown function (DUF1877)
MGVTCTICRVSSSDFEALGEDELAARLRYGAPGAQDLDKAWDGILWLISEERRERAFMLPDPDLPETQSLMPNDYFDGGEAQIAYATPSRVTKIAAALGKLDEAALRSRYDGRAMTEAAVYPEIWDRGEPDALDYLVGHFETLRETYRAAAAAGDYVLVAIA